MGFEVCVSISFSRPGVTAGVNFEEMNIRLYFQDNALHRVSRQILKEAVETMAKAGGWWTVQATQRSYTPTRYKYLFDCVYADAMPNVAERYQILDPATGRHRGLESVEELHLCMKWEFLSIQLVDPTTGEITRIPGTSTQLDDRKFFDEFVEQVICHLTELGGYGVDGCLSREEWAELKHPKNQEI